MSISGISQLLLTQFWWYFTGRFLGTSRTDSNCHSDICLGNICPGNICPGDICPYQLLLTQYWPKFKGRFLEPALTDANCYGDICVVNICPYQEYHSWPNFKGRFRKKMTSIFLSQIMLPKKIWTPNFFDPKFCRT